MTSFTNTTKGRLRKDAVPIAYENAGSNSANENVEVDEMQRDITEALSPNDENLIMKKQISEECSTDIQACSFKFRNICGRRKHNEMDAFGTTHTSRY